MAANPRSSTAAARHADIDQRADQAFAQHRPRRCAISDRRCAPRTARDAAASFPLSAAARVRRIDADRGLQRGRAVDRQERPLGRWSRSCSRQSVEAATICSEIVLLQREERIVRRRRPADPRARVRPSRHTAPSTDSRRRTARIAAAADAAAAALGRRLRTSRRAPRLSERAVEREIDLRHARRGGEAALIRRIVAAERADVVERPRLAAHDPVASDEVGAGRVAPSLARTPPRRGPAAARRSGRCCWRTRRAPCGRRRRTRKSQDGRPTSWIV